MQTAARYAAAIDILDAILAGAPAEKALTAWARSHRFAGSKDRAFIRDVVYDGLRRKCSAAALGGGMTGRRIVLGLCLHDGLDPADVFNGQGHAPAPLDADEQGVAARDPVAVMAACAPAVQLDCPDWIYDRLSAQLGPEAARVLGTLQNRAPVFLRVNRIKATPATALAALAEDGILCKPVEDMSFALEVIENKRRVRTSQAFLSGLIELQDISSQRSVELIDLAGMPRILDYCAGGGGKALALAARTDVPTPVFAHDVAPERMRDLPVRAARAGADITMLDTATLTQHAPFDVVFVDAPCSGSGTWRRTPDAKWRLRPEDLEIYIKTQREALENAAKIVSGNGLLIYATCALFREENEDQVAAFVDDFSEWHVLRQTRADLSDRGDGFFSAALQRRS